MHRRHPKLTFAVGILSIFFTALLVTTAYPNCAAAETAAESAEKPGLKEEAPSVSSFTDLRNHWAEDAVTDLVRRGLIKGYPDNTFRPNERTTRVECVAILVRVLNVKPAGEEELANLSDRNAIPLWARGAMAAAFKAGLVKGYREADGKTVFHPFAPVTRVEIAILTARLAALKTGAIQAPPAAFRDYPQIPKWALKEIDSAAARGLIKGYPDNTFRAEKEVTRAETAAMVLRLTNIIP